MSAFIEALSAPMAPPIDLLTSDWADKHRVLPRTSAARGARWVTAQTPYLRGIMDVVHEVGVRKAALMKAGQVGGSEAIHNIICRQIHHDPCPSLLIHPSMDVAEEWSKDRLTDILNSTPELAAVMSGAGTLTYKEYLDGYLAIGGANSPNSFARRAVRMAIGDDVDRWPATVGEEGDPEQLLVDRTTTFDEPIALFVSTPALKGGRIDSMYTRSDQRRYFVSCPSCHRADWITWSDGKHFYVAFENRSPESAHIVCPGCQAKIYEPERRAMIAEGQWRATVLEPKEPGLVGFHLPIMLSTFPSVTLSYMVAAFLSAKEAGIDAMRAFINTKLAEGWEERGVKRDPETLMARREDYGANVEVPSWAIALTCGVDVQVDRFELLVVGWGYGDERAVVHKAVIQGDPKLPEMQAKLMQALDRKFTHASGHLLPLHAIALDTGYAAEQMYDLVLRHQTTRRLWAIKGVGGKKGNPIILKPAKAVRNGRPVQVQMINVDDAKLNIMSGLKKEEPSGPGCIRFPANVDAVDEEFFAQLCAEHEEVVRNRRGIATHTIWVKNRERNEVLDMMVYALAAFRLLNPNIRQMFGALPKQLTPAPGHTTPPLPKQPPPKRSRVIGRMKIGGSE